MVLVSLSCVLTVVILNVFYRGTNGRRVPEWAKKYIIQGVGRFLCHRNNAVGDLVTVDSEPRQNIKVSLSFINPFMNNGITHSYQ